MSNRKTKTKLIAFRPDHDVIKLLAKVQRKAPVSTSWLCNKALREKLSQPATTKDRELAAK